MSFVVVYAFDVRPGHEADFVAAWRTVTLGLREHRGSLGSRLMRTEDGGFVAHAVWPERARWETSRANDDPAPWDEASVRMSAALRAARIDATYEVVADETGPAHAG